MRTGLMMSESMDRKGTFSFRCVADAVVPDVTISQDEFDIFLRIS